MPSASAYAAAPGQLYPRLRRRRTGRVVAGVAAGLSSHLAVDVRWVRVFFALSCFAGGFGVICYALVWVFTPLEATAEAQDGQGTGQWPWVVHVLLAALGLAGAGMSVVLTSGARGAFVFVLGVVAVGAVVAWQAYDRGMASPRNVVALVLGIVLVMGGVLAIALMGDSAGTGRVVTAVLASVFGVSILVIPLIVRLASSLVQEREAKAVANQRAEIASRLHDSVLQTLALIQKRAGDAEEVARLARAQERELRGWLFDAGDKANERAAATVFSALNRAAGEVEDLLGVTIRPVTVGDDVAFAGPTEAIVLAAREAMVNAGKHSGVDVLDVYAEHLTGELSVFVRDRGRGFDPDAVPAHRHGVRGSIVERMRRAGGAARIASAPGEGTEVELTLPL